MADAASEAGTRLAVALAWLRAADAELAGLERPVWGGVVDRWHEAGAAAADSLEACEAYERFGAVGFRQVIATAPGGVVVALVGGPGGKSPGLRRFGPM